MTMWPSRGQELKSKTASRWASRGLPGFPSLVSPAGPRKAATSSTRTRSHFHKRSRAAERCRHGPSGPDVSCPGTGGIGQGSAPFRVTCEVEDHEETSDLVRTARARRGRRRHAPGGTNVAFGIAEPGAIAPELAVTVTVIELGV